MYARGQRSALALPRRGGIIGRDSVSEEPMRHTGPPLIVLLVLWLSSGRPQGHRPSEAAGKMRLPDGLGVKLFAAEPHVRQPILVKCDERGRLWTVQYLQYPNPAGLKRVAVD